MDIAQSTINLIINILKAKKDQTNNDLINFLITLGKKLTNKYPLEFTISNIIKRSIALLRNFDENVKLEKYERLNKLMTNENINDNNTDYIQILIEFLNETDFKINDLSDHLSNFISDNDVILMLGYRDLTLETLIETKNEKKFSVIIVDVFNNEKELLYIKEKFDLNKINYEFITLNSVYPIINKVDKIVTESICAFFDGSVLTRKGGQVLSVWAKEFSIPFICLTPLYKLGPCYYFKQEKFNDFFGEPNFSKEYVEALIPQIDFIKNQEIEFHITQNGDIPINYFYKTSSEYFFDDHKDYDF